MALQDYLAEAERCSQCSYCKWIPFDQMKGVRFSRGCPSIAYNNFVSYSARGRYNVTRALLSGGIPYNERLKDVAYQCLTCGNCDVTCKICRYNLEPLDMVRELKAHLVNQGQTLPQLQRLVDGLGKLDNLMLKPKAERGRWAEGLDIRQVASEPATVLFYAGCRFSFDEELWPKVRGAVSLLKLGGVDIGVLGANEPCCGGRAYSMGYREEFMRCAAKNMALWKEAGVKTIVTSCSDCYHAFKRLYPAVGSQIQVVHTVEYLDKLIQEGRIKLTRRLPLKVTYHDPCHLGRQGEAYIPWNGREKKVFNQIIVYEPRRPRYNGSGGIYDPPRNILKAIPGVSLVEMERIREYAWCCGAGGGCREAYPAFSSWTASERIEEARSTGAEAIVTACGWCERNFKDSVSSTGGGIQVLDVAEMVQAAI